jgi:hypothetical protein
MQASRLDLQSVWIRYFSLAGNADEFEIDAYLNGLTCLTPLDRDLVSHAVNELISETAQPTAPYSNDPHDPADPEALAALSALVDLHHKNDRNDRGNRGNRNGLHGREDDRRDDQGADVRGQGR